MAGAHDQVRGIAQLAQVGHHVHGGTRVADGHHHHPGSRHARLGQHMFVARIAGHHDMTQAARLGGLPLVQLHDHVRDAGQRGGMGHVLAVQPEAHDHHVSFQVLQTGAGCLPDPAERVQAMPHRTRDEGADQPHHRTLRAVHDEGREAHGHNAHREEQLVEVGRQQAVLDAGGAEDEGELAHLRYGETREQRGAQRIAQQQGGDRGYQRLHQHRAQRQQDDREQVLPQVADVQQHADAHEEEADEHLVEGQHVAGGLDAVLALADDEAREEGAQGQAEADAAGEPGGGEADGDDAGDEELAAACAHHGVQQAGHHEAGHYVDQHQQDQHLARQPEQVAGQVLRLARQHGGEQDHGHHDHVLEDEHGRDGPPVRGAHGGLLLQQLQHDGGAGKREQEAQEQRGRPGDVPQPREQRRDPDGAQHLRPAADEHYGPQRGQRPQAELDADHEEQEDDSHLGQQLHLVALRHQPQPVRTEDGAGGQEAQQRGQLEAPEQQGQPHGQAQDQHHLLQQGDLHGAKVSGPGLRDRICLPGIRPGAPA